MDDARSTALLMGFRRGRPGEIDLTLRPEYTELLRQLGNPHKNLPPVLHVAGTNGKGSTCAFLRSILEAAGKRVHVYTSPHLIRFHERFRVAGQLISETELVALLEECQGISNSFPPDGGITMFEAATAVALASFARTAADYTILETGLGGRLDATNVVPGPIATLITRLSFDHREFLGQTLSEIANEKAGIMRTAVPCFAVPQPNLDARETLVQAAATKGSPLFMGGDAWTVEPDSKESGFRYADAAHNLLLPAPALLGHHQFWNAGLAIAAVLRTGIADELAIREGVRRVKWSARLEKITAGNLKRILGSQQELWIDGGHNDSAGDVLADQASLWEREVPPRPLHLILGMLKTKTPAEFLRNLLPHIGSMHTVPIPNEPQGFAPDDLRRACETAGAKHVTASDGIRSALMAIRETDPRARVLILGSLYLAGSALKENGTFID